MHDFALDRLMISSTSGVGHCLVANHCYNHNSCSYRKLLNNQCSWLRSRAATGNMHMTTRKTGMVAMVLRSYTTFTSLI